MRRRHDPVSYGSATFSSLSEGPFLVTDARFGPSHALPKHTHERTVLAITVEGCWDSVLGPRTCESRPGFVLTEPAGEPHANHFGSTGARVVILQPDPAFDDWLHPCRALLGEVNHFQSPALPRLARKLSSELGSRDDLTPLAIQGLSLEILAQAAARQRRLASARGSRWLPRIDAYLRAHFLESPSVADLALVAGVHPSHFARAFRAEFDCSPASYVRRLRLDWAARQLLATTDPIAQIAAAARFADQSHFTRAFVRFAGTSPARYRRASPAGARTSR